MNPAGSVVPQSTAPPRPDDQALRTALENLIVRWVLLSVDVDKVHQLGVLRRMSQYLKGNQSLTPARGTDGRSDLIRTKDALVQRGQFDDAAALKDYCLNDFKGDLRKYIAILGSKAPNSTCTPKWKDSDQHVAQSCTANEVNAWLQDEWNVEEINRKLVYSLCTAGESFFYTPYESDGRRLGVSSIPVFEAQDVQLEPDRMVCGACGFGTEDLAGGACPQCGAGLDPEQHFQPGETTQIPVQTSTEDIPNGTVHCYIKNGWNVTTPFNVGEWRKCPWLMDEGEQQCAELLARYPLEYDELSKKLGQFPVGKGSAGSMLGVYSRLESSSPLFYRTMSAATTVWLETNLWIEPQMYEYIRAEANNQPVYDWIAHTFPDGMKIPMVQGEVLLKYLENEGLHEVWTPVDPDVGLWLWKEPIFKEYLIASDLINDFRAMFIDLVERSMPINLYDPKVINAKALKNRSIRAAEFIPALPNASGRLGDGVKSLTLSVPDPNLMQFVEKIKETARDNIGMNPTVFGGDDALPTADQAKRKLNQALMVLATTWNCIRSGIKGARYNAIRQLAKHSGGKLYSSDGAIETLRVKIIDDIRSLMQGGWTVEVDQAIPMSWAQIRDFVENLFTQSPQRATLYGVDDPDNMRTIMQGIGLVGWKLQGEEVRKAVVKKIQLLVTAQPNPDGSPSEPPDPFLWGDPQVGPAVLRQVRNWMLSPAGDEVRGNGPQPLPGYQNLLAWGMALKTILMPPTLPPGQEGQGGASAPPSQPGQDATAPPPPGSMPPPAPETGEGPPPTESGLMPPNGLIM